MRNKIVEEHYRDSYDKFVSIARNRLGGNHHLAEEAVQEAYTRAIKYWDTFEGGDKPFGNWIMSILNNVISDIRVQELHRGVVVEAEHLENMSEGEIVGLEHSAMNDQLLRLAEREIERETSPAKREVLTLHFRNQLTPKEIEELSSFGMKKHAIQKAIQRFRDGIVAIHGANSSGKSSSNLGNNSLALGV